MEVTHTARAVARKTQLHLELQARCARWQCNQRPKFQGFEYCGKTCAQAARGAKPSQGGNQQQKKPANTTRTATPQKNPAPPTMNPSMPAQFPTVHPQLQPAVPTKCRTDDCWEMSETDALGNKISDYCSEEHAEWVIRFKFE
ncbi:hypothetical protein H0H93_009947 [Arthromyces matolae]|nr:hypothetical protein H0H93_009947 [Arthromyces matolae]